jgi:hypothetical protein
MSYLVETIEKGNYKINIFQDECAENPRKEWDNATTMLCFHSRYNLGDKNPYHKDEFSSWEEFEKEIIRTYKPVVIKPVYLYDHSGITVSTSPFGCSWDSGQVGFIFVSREQALHEYGGKKVTKKHKEWAYRIIESEMKCYDYYVRGDVYGFKVEDENGEEIDSCWGFYGSNHKESGLIEHAMDYIPEEELKKEEI